MNYGEDPYGSHNTGRGGRGGEEIEEDVCVRELQVVYTWSNLFEQS